MKEERGGGEARGGRGQIVWISWTMEKTLALPE